MEVFSQRTLKMRISLGEEFDLEGAQNRTDMVIEFLSDEVR
jgi:hypothetical protein